MSSSSAGKFQDHYALLGVEPSADSETIQAAYAKLAQRYHPNNSATGDKAKFESVNQAYEVLSDPGLRASFDKVKGVDLEQGNPKFTGADFFQSLEQGFALRSSILCILYDRRRLKPFRPGLSMRNLEGMLTIPGDELGFALWYLKQRGLVVSDDKSNVEITVDGMDFLERNRPQPGEVVSFIKPESLKNPLVVAQSASGEGVMNVLSRALQRADDARPRIAVK